MILQLMDDSDDKRQSSAFNHSTPAAMREMWRTVHSVKKQISALRREADVLAFSPSLLLQSLGEAAHMALESWLFWLADEDAEVARYATYQDRQGKPLTLITFLKSLAQRFGGPAAILNILVAEKQEAERVGRRHPYDPISLVNKLHASFVLHGTTESPHKARVTADIGRCFWSLASPMLREVAAWIDEGAPFEMTPSTRRSDLFLRHPTLSCFEDTFWTDGYSFPKMDADMPHVPAFLAERAPALLQAGLSVGLLHAAKHDMTDVAEFPSATADVSDEPWVDPIERAKTQLDILLPRIRLSQKRAHDFFVAPVIDGGRGLYEQLHSIHDMFLMRRGAEMHAWCEEIFLRVSARP